MRFLRKDTQKHALSLSFGYIIFLSGYVKSCGPMKTTFPNIVPQLPQSCKSIPKATVRKIVRELVANSNYLPPQHVELVERPHGGFCVLRLVTSRTYVSHFSQHLAKIQGSKFKLSPTSTR